MTLNDELKGFCKLHPLNVGVDFNQFSLLALKEFTDLTKEPRSRRLGKRSEFYFEKRINQSKKFEVKASNIQVIEGKKTVGELDFIIEDNSNKETIHVELVTKVYLFAQDKGAEVMHQLVGPNLKDSYFLKREKLRNKQLPLLDLEATKAILNESGIERVDRQEVAFLANVYLPLDFKGEVPFNAECVNGVFVRESELNAFIEEGDEYHLPAKKFWFCDPESNEDWCTEVNFRLQIATFFAEKRSPLCWLKRNNNYSAFFVVWW